MNFKNASNQKGSKLRAKDVLAKVSFTTYYAGGKKYKLKINTDTYGTVVNPNGVPGTFWNLVGYKAIHKRRNWGVFSKYAAPELSVYGDQRILLTNNTVVWQPFTSGIGYTRSEVSRGFYYVNAYNATAKCLGHDNVYHYVSASESR